jgi:hypothetical protein
MSRLGHEEVGLRMIKRNFSRNLYYKAGYLIDFPRTINSLAGYKDSTYQVQVFQRVLQKKPYFISLDSTPLAEACSWREFIDWLNKGEIEGKDRTQEESAGKAAEDGAARKAEQEEEITRVAEKDFRRDAAERYVQENTIKEMHTNQQSPNGPSLDRKPPSTEPSWSVVDDGLVIEDDDEDEEGYEPPTVCRSSHCRKVKADSLQCPPPPKVPLGWKAIWHDKYNEYYFVDIYTKRPRWQLPTKPTPSRGNSPTPSRGNSPTPVPRHLNTSTSSETMSVPASNTRRNS